MEFNDKFDFNQMKSGMYAILVFNYGIRALFYFR